MTKAILVEFDGEPLVSILSDNLDGSLPWFVETFGQGESDYEKCEYVLTASVFFPVGFDW